MFVSEARAETPRLYDWGAKEAPVLVTNDSGVIFLGENRKAWRAYSWERAEGENKEGLFLVDLDQDGSSDVVAAGEPTFAIRSNSNPWWTLDEGCRQVIVANFAADDKPDIMCNQGTEIGIYTHDRQKVWTLDLGVRLDHCKAADINGDLKADLECRYADREAWIRVDAEGDILAQESEESEIEETENGFDQASPVSSEVWEGEKEYDLNGDGTAEESIVADGSALVLKSRSKKKAVARTDVGGEIRAALVKNLDGEGEPEIVALTDSRIVVLDNEGEKLGSYSSDAGEYKRYPVAKLKNAYGRKFADNNKASAAVEEANEKFAKCYEDRVRGKLLVGTGEVILNAYIGKDGSVDRIELMHSAIDDDEVESCAKDVLRGLEFPKPKKKEDGEGRQTAKMNVILQFTFADET